MGKLPSRNEKFGSKKNKQASNLFPKNVVNSKQQKQASGRLVSLFGKFVTTRRVQLLLSLCLFLLGLVIVIYPIVSQVYYEYHSEEKVRIFDHDRQLLKSDEITRRMNLAKGYNHSLIPKTLQDPFTDEEKEGIAEYARMLEVNEQIGSIKIPSIQLEAPIYAGTSDKVLESGIGHLEGTSLPIGGQGSHAVLTGHRGLPTARLFTDLDKVKIGDRIYIQNIQQTLAYEVDDIEIVEPSDFDSLFVDSEKDKVTLLTCTPYMINTQRLLIHTHRVANVEEMHDILMERNLFNKIGKEYLIAILLLLIVLIIRLVTQKLKNRQRKEKNRV